MKFFRRCICCVHSDDSFANFGARAFSKAMPPRRKRGRDTASPAQPAKRKLDPDTEQSSPANSQVKHVALLRGINVGSAKQVPMVTLARCFEELGYSDVKTVLRSGNVVFNSEEAQLDADAGPCVEAAVLKATGVQSSVMILTGSRFVAIAEANPLVEVSTDGSKSFVSFVARVPEDLARPEASELGLEVLEIGEEAVYQWMPAGWLKTVVPKSFWKQFNCPVTTRNWNTVQKILALLR